MKMKTSDFRKMAHSIKFIEFYWSEYQRKFPDSCSNYKYLKKIDEFIINNKYNELITVKHSRWTNTVVVSDEQYEEIHSYAHISDDLKQKLTT